MVGLPGFFQQKKLIDAPGVRFLLDFGSGSTVKRDVSEGALPSMRELRWFAEDMSFESDYLFEAVA